MSELVSPGSTELESDGENFALLERAVFNSDREGNCMLGIWLNLEVNRDFHGLNGQVFGIRHMLVVLVEVAVGITPVASFAPGATRLVLEGVRKDDGLPRGSRYGLIRLADSLGESFSPARTFLLFFVFRARRDFNAKLLSKELLDHVFPHFSLVGTFLGSTLHEVGGAFLNLLVDVVGFRFPHHLGDDVLHNDLRLLLFCLFSRHLGADLIPAAFTRDSSANNRGFVVVARISDVLGLDEVLHNLTLLFGERFLDHVLDGLTVHAGGLNHLLLHHGLHLLLSVDDWLGVGTCQVLLDDKLESPMLWLFFENSVVGHLKIAVILDQACFVF